MLSQRLSYLESRINGGDGRGMKKKPSATLENLDELVNFSFSNLLLHLASIARATVFERIRKGKPVNRTSIYQEIEEDFCSGLDSALRGSLRDVLLGHNSLRNSIAIQEFFSDYDSLDQDKKGIVDSKVSGSLNGSGESVDPNEFINSFRSATIELINEFIDKRIQELNPPKTFAERASLTFKGISKGFLSFKKIYSGLRNEIVSLGGRVSNLEGDLRLVEDRLTGVEEIRAYERLSAKRDVLGGIGNFFLNSLKWLGLSAGIALGGYFIGTGIKAANLQRGTTIGLEKRIGELSARLDEVENVLSGGKVVFREDLGSFVTNDLFESYKQSVRRDFDSLRGDLKVSISKYAEFSRTFTILEERISNLSTKLETNMAETVDRNELLLVLKDIGDLKNELRDLNLVTQTLQQSYTGVVARVDELDFALLNVNLGLSDISSNATTKGEVLELGSRIGNLFGSYQMLQLQSNGLNETFNVFKGRVDESLVRLEGRMKEFASSGEITVIREDVLKASQELLDLRVLVDKSGRDVNSLLSRIGIYEGEAEAVKTAQDRFSNEIDEVYNLLNRTAGGVVINIESGLSGLVFNTKEYQIMLERLDREVEQNKEKHQTLLEYGNLDRARKTIGQSKDFVIAGEPGRAVKLLLDLEGSLGEDEIEALRVRNYRSIAQNAVDDKIKNAAAKAILVEDTMRDIFDDTHSTRVISDGDKKGLMVKLVPLHEKTIDGDVAGFRLENVPMLLDVNGTYKRLSNVGHYKNFIIDPMTDILARCVFVNELCDHLRSLGRVSEGGYVFDSVIEVRLPKLDEEANRLAHNLLGMLLCAQEFKIIGLGGSGVDVDISRAIGNTPRRGDFLRPKVEESMNHSFSRYLGDANFKPYLDRLEALQQNGSHR